MKKNLLFILLIFVSCIQKKAPVKPNPVNTKTKATPIDSNYIANDTTITPFADKSYKVNVHTFDRGINNSDYNTLLIFEHSQNGIVKQLLKDSLYCYNYAPDVQLVDMNNDKVNDIMITSEMSGGNSNIMYHLYLCDTNTHQLIRVRDFENLYNPVLNSKYNIIESLVISGTNYYTFHRINSKNKLINLGHGFDISRRVQDSDKMKAKYNNAIKQMIKEHKD